MADPTETTAPEHTKISLEEMANRYLDSLQKTYDMVCYTLAGSRRLNEADYDEFSQQLQVMPRQVARMEFERAKFATEQWLLRTSLADSLALVIPVLEDARTICALCDFKASGSRDQDALQKIATVKRSEFLQQPIEDKFKLLAEKYNITCEVTPHVLGLMEITKALMTKDGILTEEESEDGAMRRLLIRSVQIVQTPDADTSGGNRLSLSRKVGDSERQIKVGEKIHFTKAEHLGSLLTMGIFITDILKGIQLYAQSTGAAD